MTGYRNTPPAGFGRLEWVQYRLACWWLDSPRVERLRRYVERRAA